MATEITGINGNSKREDRLECRGTLTTKTKLVKSCWQRICQEMVL